jgi:hypothetical protein
MTSKRIEEVTEELHTGYCSECTLLRPLLLTGRCKECQSNQPPR